MLKLYTKNLSQKHYFAPLFSFSSLLGLGFIAGLLIIPFAIAYISGRGCCQNHSSVAFWSKLNVYQEQPQVLLQQDVFALFEGWNSGAPLQIYYSSEPAITQQLDPTPRVSTLKTYNVDYTADGHPDAFWINMTVPLSSTETIYHVRLAFALKVTLSSRIRMVAPAMGMIDISSALPGSGVQADGFLQISQTSLMTDKLSYSNTDPIFDYATFYTSDVNAISWPRIVSNYLDRSFQPSYQATTIWNFPPSSTEPFKVSVKVRIPTWQIQYRPGILEVLKNGWIQYLSVFIFTGLILGAAWDFLITHQIIKTIAYSQARPGAKVMY
ncbi:hypothetical protein HDU91_006685 [Kappamyces sp. JEL0680]|nr:hypothetical protein HDU91_006685 [Kappamyces sp. JEL0680]